MNTPLEIIKKYIVLSQYSQTELAEKLGITTQALNYKLNGHRAFKFSEIQELVAILEIPRADAGEMLFP